MTFASATAAQTGLSKTPNEDGQLAAMRLENVHIKAQGLGQLFSTLSLSFEIPIGLEIAANDDDFVAYSVDFEAGTLSDFLTQFVSRHNQYAWEIKGGVVNVFPIESHRDVVLDQLLKAEIRNFSVKENTNCLTFEKALVETSEIRTILELNDLTFIESTPGGFYIHQLGRHYKLDVSNMTLKSILNKVVKESPTAKLWLIKRNDPDRKLLLRVSARQEDLPASTKSGS